VVISCLARSGSATRAPRRGPGQPLPQRRAGRVRDREPERQQPDVQQQPGHHRGHRAAAGQHHADRGELRAAGEDQRGQRDGHPHAQPAGDGDRAERDADQPVGEAEQGDVPADCSV
jgi:hypothetical protein